MRQFLNQIYSWFIMNTCAQHYCLELQKIYFLWLKLLFTLLYRAELFIGDCTSNNKRKKDHKWNYGKLFVNSSSSQFSPDIPAECFVVCIIFVSIIIIFSKFKPPLKSNHDIAIISDSLMLNSIFKTMFHISHMVWPVNIIPWISCLSFACPVFIKHRCVVQGSSVAAKLLHNEKTTSSLPFAIPSYSLFVWGFGGHHKHPIDAREKDEFSRIFWRQF